MYNLEQSVLGYREIAATFSGKVGSALQRVATEGLGEEGHLHCNREVRVSTSSVHRGGRRSENSWLVWGRGPLQTGTGPAGEEYMGWEPGHRA